MPQRCSRPDCGTVNARSAVRQSVTLALACLASYSLVRYASAHIHSLSHADDLVGGLWAVIATAFVFRTSEGESITAAKTRVAATALSFALCVVYLLFLPSHPWGMALLVAAPAFGARFRGANARGSAASRASPAGVAAEGSAS